MQSVRTGIVSLADVPPPAVCPNGILVQTACSLISPGTERAGMAFSQKNLLSKARGRPDLVRQVLDKARRDGFVEAARAALARLERPLPLGYASAGRVIAAGPEAAEFNVGDLVACAGAGYACHAEVNYIPRNLAVPVPRTPSGETLSAEEAAFATLGAVALHAVRLSRAGVGDRAVVVGLGLVGLLTGQILRSLSAAVWGVDPHPGRCRLAKELGFLDAVPPEGAKGRLLAATEGPGADVVLIAAAGADNSPIQLAGEIARDRGQIVVVGDTGLEIPRRDFYRKELSVIVSRSYGPGRYDPNFEERGQDYPPGYVRWTERENMRAFLDLVAQGRVRVQPLITERIPIGEAERAYERLLAASDSLGIILTYPEVSVGTEAPAAPVRIASAPGRPAPRPGAVGVSVLGAGAFAASVLLPILRALPEAHCRGIVTASGHTARWAADRFGFRFSASDPEAVGEDPDPHAVIVAPRHDLHASLVRRGLEAGKAVFVEKPLCLTEEELGGIVEAYNDQDAGGGVPLVMVGFNRRFSPLVQELCAFFGSLGLGAGVSIRVNAGPLPPDSWVLDPVAGGGRILSEVCHFVDLAAHLADSPPVTVFAQGAGGDAGSVAITLRHASGAVSIIGYFCGGDRSFAKERIEVFGGGGVAVVDDFRRAVLMQGGRRRRLGGLGLRQQKGHREEVRAFLRAVQAGQPSPVPFGEAVTATRVTFAILKSLGCGQAIPLLH